jgi:hypothetical protein
MPQQNFTVEYGLTVGTANITAASGNIATVGNILANSANLTGTLAVTGNASVGNIGATAGSFTGNINTANLTVSGLSELGNVGNVQITGGVSGYVLTTDGTGNLTWQPSGGGTVSAGTASQLTYYAATGDTVSATGANLTWNGTDLLTVTGNLSAGNIAGTLTTASQPNITSVGTLSSLDVTGNLSAGNISGLLTTSAQTNITSLGTLANLTVTGNVNATAVNSNITSTGTSDFFNATVGNLLSVTATTESTSTTTGAIVTAGGLGVAKNAYFGADVNIAGNLNVTGNTTIVNANDITIADKTFVLANNAGTGALADGAGIVVGNVQIATWLYSNDTVSWETNVDLTPNANASLDLGDPAYVWNNVYAANLYATIQTAAQPNITSLGTLSALTVSGNIGAGNVSATLIAGTLTTSSQPNITSLGTLSSLTVTGNLSAGNVSTSGNIALCQLKVNNCNVATAIANETVGGWGNIGAAGQGFDTVFARAASANNADLAEIYASDHMYEYGTVMVFGGENEVTVSTTTHDTRIAGVVSQYPAFLMNDTASGVPIALTGRVPCRVLGPVHKGTLLVSSNLPGVACAVDPDRFQPGCVIGKSLEQISSASVQLIEVVVGRL